jgi:hypothetical protein
MEQMVIIGVAKSFWLSLSIASNEHINFLTPKNVSRFFAYNNEP